MIRKSDFFAVGVFILAVVASGFAVTRSYFLPSITADIENTGAPKEILENNDFSREPFNNIIWKKFSNGAGNIPVVENSRLKLGIENSVKDGYQIIAQPVALHAGKSYTISIDFTENKDLSGSEGFASETILGKPIFEKDFSEAVFTPDKEIGDAFFFLKVKAGKPGFLEIAKVSVVESPQVAVSAELSPEISATISPSITPISTLSLTPAPTPTLTPTPIPTATLTPKITQTSTLDSTPLVFPSRWSFVGFLSPIDTNLLTEGGLKVYAMHGGSWKVAFAQTKDSDFTTLPQDGLYIFNPKETEVSIDQLNPALANGSIYPSKGWNLLYNSKDSPVSAENFTVDLGKKGTAAIANLIAKNNASETFYILKQTKSGVALENGDFKKDKIPAKSAFWLYLF